MLRINKIHWPVTVLGYGRRIGIWTQGCSIHCKDCCSNDTWPEVGGAEMHTTELLEACATLAADQHLDGITISGGEPFDQVEGLADLLKALDGWRQKRFELGAPPFDILCYSGYSLEKLQTRHPDILNMLDCLICDPYLAGQSASFLRGSENQRIVPMTALGEVRASALKASDQTKRLQFHLDQEQVWFVGIPAEGDLERLAEHCRQRGLLFKEVTWRA